MLSQSIDGRLFDDTMMTILSGEGRLLSYDPMDKADFRPKDMSIRRSRMLDNINFDPSINLKDSVLPLSLDSIREKHRAEAVQVKVEPPKTRYTEDKKISRFASLLASHN